MASIKVPGPAVSPPEVRYTAPAPRPAPRPAASSRSMDEIKRLPGRALAQRRRDLPDIGPHAGETRGVANAHHPGPPARKIGQQALVSTPIAHHHLGAGGQHRLARGAPPGQAARFPGQIGVGVERASGQPDDGGARAQGQDVLVSALVQGENPGGGPDGRGGHGRQGGQGEDGRDSGDRAQGRQSATRPKSRPSSITPNSSSAGAQSTSGLVIIRAAMP